MKKFAKNNKNGLIFIAVIIIAGISIWAVINYSKNPAFSQSQFVEVKKGPIETELSEDITIKPTTEIDLSFENGGKIKNILVSVGDQVKKGQLLAEVENSDYLASLRGAQANAEAAEAQLEAAKENVDVQKAKENSLINSSAAKYDVKAQKEQKYVAKSGVDAQYALLDAAQAAVNEASLQLAKTRLVAPIDGVITDKPAEVGEIFSAALPSPVLQIASGDKLQAETFVSELDVKKITVSDGADISLSSADGNAQTFSAKVANIYPAEKNDNGVSSYKVVFELDGQIPDLKSGMTGTAHIKLSEKSSALYISQSSLFSDAGKKYVMVMSGSFPERREVQVGESGTDGTVEILSGLSEGDKIIKFSN